MTAKMKPLQEICIIGAGLSGLTLAYLLQNRGFRPTVVEASLRPGGRIQTVRGTADTPLELGATWFSDMHPQLLSLIGELGLKKYPQYSKGISLFQTKSFEPPQKFFVPESESPSYRLAGGTQALIDTLVRKLSPDSLRLNTRITSLTDRGSSMLLKTATGVSLYADSVVLCIPPQLAANKITFSPELPDTLGAIISEVQTWMSGSVKFTLEYDSPFWREDGYSGMLYSHAGIVTEMYDHTNYEENKYGLTGFLHGGAAAYSPRVRKELVLKQLGELLGEKALLPSAYFDKVWNDEFVSGGSQEIQHPHQYNGHPLLQEAYMHGKLFFAATETSSQFPGYMEGAIVAARSVAARL